MRGEQVVEARGNEEMGSGDIWEVKGRESWEAGDMRGYKTKIGEVRERKEYKCGEVREG